jgi:hypothetical protein
MNWATVGERVTHAIWSHETSIVNVCKSSVSLNVFNTFIANVSATGAAKQKQQMGKELESWTKQDVQKWLSKNELGHLSKNMKQFDGPMMVQLRTMQRNSPGVGFYEKVQDWLGIKDLSDLLKLSSLLEKL